MRKYESGGVEKHKISKRYGFSLRNLNRPDLFREIGGELSRRPDFDKAEIQQTAVKKIAVILKMRVSLFISFSSETARKSSLRQKAGLLFLYQQILIVPQ